MDDPRLARSVKLRALHTGRVLVMAIGLIVAGFAGVVKAEEPSGVTPVPPVTEPGRLEASSTYESPAYRAPNVASYPEMAWHGGILPLVPREPVYLASGNAPTNPLPRTERPLFQLVSLQEPADPAPDDNDQGANGNAQGQQSQQRYGKEPVSNTLQFLRNQDVLLDPGSWQFDVGFNYTLFDTQFPVPITDATSGNVTDVLQGTIRQRLLYSPFAVRYGLTKNVQLYGVLPAGYTDTQTSTFGSSVMTHGASLGDLSAGLNIHLCKAEADYPDVIATIGCTAPCGNYVAPVDVVIPGLGLGQGFWAINGQLTMIHRYDPVIVFYGGGYRHLFSREFGDTFFAAGEQINYLIGTGFSVNDRVTLSTALQGLYVTNTRVDHATVRGSNVEPISLRFATTISRRCKILEPYISIGLTPSAPAASLGLTITYY